MFDIGRADGQKIHVNEDSRVTSNHHSGDLTLEPDALTGRGDFAPGENGSPIPEDADFRSGYLAIARMHLNAPAGKYFTE